VLAFLDHESSDKDNDFVENLDTCFFRRMLLVPHREEEVCAIYLRDGRGFTVISNSIQKIFEERVIVALLYGKAPCGYLPRL
jgi:hypothetical protein